MSTIIKSTTSLRQTMESRRRLSAAIAKIWVKSRRDPWLTEEAAKAARQHTLLEDNPSSG